MVRVEDEREYFGYLMYQLQCIMCISQNAAFSHICGTRECERKERRAEVKEYKKSRGKIDILQDDKKIPQRKKKGGKRNDVEMLSLQLQNANVLQICLST